MKCMICGRNKGKRTCRLHNGGTVCSLCCATVRTVDQCGECPHFKEAERYRNGRIRQGHRPEFTVRIDERVEKETDRALQQIELGYGVAEAEARIRQLYREDPDLWCTQYAMGVVYLAHGDAERAAVHFEQAVTTDPYFAEAHYNLSACHQQSVEPLKAIRSLQAARDVAKPGTGIHTKANARLRELADVVRRTEGVGMKTFLQAGEVFDRGVASMDKGDFRQAIIEFRESLRIRPNAPQPYGNLGICFGKLGMKERAMAMLDRALEIDPTYEPAMWNRDGIGKSGESGADVDVTSIQYSAARYLEEKERAKGGDGASGGSVSALLDRLRRQNRQ